MLCNHKYPHQPHFSSFTFGRSTFPIQGLGAPTIAPQKTPKNHLFPYHVFKRLKHSHATTNTHTSYIFFHHTNSFLFWRGNFPIQGPWGPPPQPQNSQTSPQKTHYPYHVFKQLKRCHATTNTHTSHILLNYTVSCTPGRGNFPIQDPRGRYHSPRTARHTPFLSFIFKWLI